jgi:hypothetical protein
MNAKFGSSKTMPQDPASIQVNRHSSVPKSPFSPKISNDTSPKPKNTPSQTSKLKKLKEVEPLYRFGDH